METREAYDAIRAAIAADPQKTVIGEFYDEQAFGNFECKYEDKDGQRLSLVNDRGQLVLLNGPDVDELKVVLLQDLYRADRKTLLEVIP